MKVIMIIGGMTFNKTFTKDIFPTLQAAMGTGGGNIPMIVIEKEEQVDEEV